MNKETEKEEDLSRKLAAALKDEKLAEAHMRAVKAWKNLTRTCKDVSLFLGYVIAQVQFISKDGKTETRACTGNRSLIKSVLKAKGKKIPERQSFSNRITQFDEKAKTLTTWDIEAEKYITVSLAHLEFMNFIEIIPENIELLNRIMANVK